jgi:hypothetical protein
MSGIQSFESFWSEYNKKSHKVYDAHNEIENLINKLEKVEEAIEYLDDPIKNNYAKVNHGGKAKYQKHNEMLQELIKQQTDNKVHKETVLSIDNKFAEKMNKAVAEQLSKVNEGDNKYTAIHGTISETKETISGDKY